MVSINLYRNIRRYNGLVTEGDVTSACVIEICMFHPSLGRLNVATWKRLTDVEKSDLEIDLDTIAFMRRNGNGTDITLDTGQTVTVRESPEDVRKRPRQLVF